MSDRARVAVYDHSIHASTRLLVMLAIANAANDAQVAGVSIDEVARNSRISERQAQNIMSALEASGEIYRSLGGGRRNTTRYLITLGLDEARIAQTIAQWFDVKLEAAVEAAAQCAARLSARKAEQDNDAPAEDAPSDATGEETPKPSKPPKPPKEPAKGETSERKRDPLFDAVAAVAVMNPALCGSRIAKATNALRKVEATPAQVSEFRTWWLSDTWRASNTPVPTPEQILSNWEKARQGVQKPAGAPVAPQKQSVAERVIGRRMGALGYERAQ